jgi:hypothetical protein
VALRLEKKIASPEDNRPSGSETEFGEGEIDRPWGAAAAHEESDKPDPIKERGGA